MGTVIVGVVLSLRTGAPREQAAADDNDLLAFRISPPTSGISDSLYKTREPASFL
jgi:hypothetical protein